jgi:hypothetical protein
MMKKAPYLIKCKGCNRPLIERMESGLLKFIYGQPWKRSPDGNWIKAGSWVPIEMVIHGSIKMKCWRKQCQTWNIVNFLPGLDEQALESVKIETQQQSAGSAEASGGVNNQQHIKENGR